MVSLEAKAPCDEHLPIEVGDCRLSAVDHEYMTLLSPYKGKEKLLGAVLKSTYGIGFPAAGKSSKKAGVRCVWFGLDQAMLIGPAPDKTLAKTAALVDQSDSWAVVRLQGAQAVDVLARLTPVDLRPSEFKTGAAARSELRHMMVSISRVGPQAYEIMAFRSMAKTLVHDLQDAMKSLAAQ